MSSDESGSATDSDGITVYFPEDTFDSDLIPVGDTEAISKWLEEHKISEVECLVPDVTGNARGKFIPAYQFITERDHKLPESIMVQTVTGEYTDDHWDFVEPTDTDMILRPDASTLRMVPWAREPTAQVIADCYKPNGDPHPLSSRNVLRYVLSLYEEAGLKPILAPEVEFYLVHKNTDPDYELIPPKGRSGRRESARLSYSIDAVAEFEDFVEDMYDYADAQELNLDTLIHENGAAQMEVNFNHGDPLSLADQVFAFKRTVRETALQHDMYATFMARPMQKEPGSALHLHQSVIDIATGKNIFCSEAGKPTAAMMHFIGGLQRYTPELISFYAPNVNSYRRLAPDISAPINLSWGFDNRTTAFRVPNSDAANLRIENRFPGADANPYLAITASLASGLLGMRQKLDPTPPHRGTANDDAVVLARTLEEGVRRLNDTPELQAMIGELFMRAYAAVKLDEFEEFNRVISRWEREHLLLQV
ncbi:putative glutamine synthetase [Luminiphilus syltensis NOR5-1B]|uniref:Putative glutamine synthetase n=1 Tax=Luminiphilus syltensis NOR5-1B TaxID=565045 RepID=B8KUW4_9GAMM|nr:glutamine synthetase family protein [Luminiphilus syltensis]EED35199.1 putative glutamine synthetase [Luminiphilus syltensis NOR5-1B]